MLVYIVFRHVPVVVGWNYYQVLFLYGFVSAAVAISDFFEGRVRRLGSMIIDGNLDFHLIRPVNAPFLLMCSFVQPEAAVYFIFSMVIMGIATVHLPGLCSPFIIALPLMIILAAVLLSAITFAFSCVAFWFVGLRGVFGVVSYLNSYCHYPLHLYPSILQIIFKWLLPMGFVGPVAAAALLSGNTVRICYTVLIEIALCLLWIGVAVIMWNNGIKRYQSCGN